MSQNSETGCMDEDQSSNKVKFQRAGILAQFRIKDGASLVTQIVRNLPAMRKTWVQSLGWEDPWRRE